MASEKPKNELSKATVKSLAHGSLLIRRTLADIKALQERSARKLRIVATDDEPRILDLYKAYLELSCQATVLTTTSSEEALRLAVAEPPDLFITDVMKPGINGMELIKMLRAHERTRSVPIWVITGTADVLGAALLEVGADVVMQKPIELADLLHRANQLILKREFS